MPVCKLVTFFILGVLMLLMLGGLMLSRHFYKRLKADHPEVYKSLGEPTPFFNQSIKIQCLVNKFIWKRQYLALHDESLTKLCNFMFIYSFVLWGVLIAFAVMTFLYGVS
jgi:hypothetical protein